MQDEIASGTSYLVYQHSKSINVTFGRWFVTLVSRSKDLWRYPVYGRPGHGKDIEHDDVQPVVCEASTWLFLVAY